MAQPQQQENTPRRRTEILDADFVPREEAPVVPRVRGAAPQGPLVSPLAVLTVLIALLAVGVAVTKGAAFSETARDPVVLTREARLPAASLRPSTTAAPVPKGEASLGVAAETVRPAVAAYYTMKDRPMVPGAQVYALDEEGPAAAAGLQPGDVITATGEQDVFSAEDLARVEAGSRAGDTLSLTVFRNGEYLELEAVLSPRSESDRADFFHSVEGG